MPTISNPFNCTSRIWIPGIQLIQIGFSSDLLQMQEFQTDFEFFTITEEPTWQIAWSKDTWDSAVFNYQENQNLEVLPNLKIVLSDKITQADFSAWYRQFQNRPLVVKLTDNQDIEYFLHPFKVLMQKSNEEEKDEWELTFTPCKIIPPIVITPPVVCTLTLVSADLVVQQPPACSLTLTTATITEIIGETKSGNLIGSNLFDAS